MSALANLHPALDLAEGEPPGRFRLFEPGATELVRADARKTFHSLHGVELMETRVRRGRPTSYRETRVWVIEALGTTFVGRDPQGSGTTVVH